MTAIAYKDGVIAYDSRITANSLITDDEAMKMVRRGDLTFFLTGATSDYEAFMKAYAEGGSVDEKNDCAALVLDKGSVIYSSDEEGRIFKCPVKSPYSIGSGSPFALAAMDMGADAKTAVKMAAKRDTCTGGKIRTFKI